MSARVADLVGGTQARILVDGDRTSLRVLHVIASLAPRRGGPSKVVRELCGALAEHGLTVEVFTTREKSEPLEPPAPSPDASQTPGGAERQKQFILRTFPARWPHRFAYSPEMARELRRRVPEFDLVHLHGLYQFPTMVAARVARISGTPYVVEPHGSFAPILMKHHAYRKRLYGVVIANRILRRAAAVRFSSEWEAGQGVPVAAQQSLVVPQAIDPSEFENLPHSSTFAESHPELKGKSLVVFVGRITRKKGLDLLLRAFACVAKQLPASHLILAGPDDEGYGAELRDLIKQMGISSKVTTLGMVVGRAKLVLLSAAGVWVLPSYDENFGIAVLEAMACGIPLVISDQVGIHPEIASARAGLVVRCEVDDLASGITRAMVDEDLRRQLSANARELLKSRFTWSQASAQMVNAYWQLRRLR